jgi:hypothetical protein
MSEIYVADRPIRRINHIINDHATNARQMTRTRSIVTESLPYLEHRYIRTSINPEDTVSEIHDGARPFDLYLGYGGESTNNAMAMAAISGPLAELGSPQFFFPGGNKNDLSHELNAKNVEKHPMEAIYSSILREAFPIEFHIQSQLEGLIKHRLAVAYGSVGVTGEISKALVNKRDLPMSMLIRSNKFTRSILDGIWTLEGLAKSRKFEIIDHNNQDEVIRLAEIGYINISQMAGNLVLTSVLVDDLLAVRIEASRKSALVAELIALAIGMSEKTIVDEINDDFTLKSPATLHVDAEPEQLAAGTRIKTNRSTVPMYVLGKP